LRDPVWERTGGALRGRDGCRVPLPWTAKGPSFGFGSGAGWLPQPAWFGRMSREAQEEDPQSALHLYRAALALRRRLQTGDATFTWIDSGHPQALQFRRSNGWQCLINLGDTAVPTPAGWLLIASHDVGPAPALVPPDTAVWLIGDTSRRPGSDPPSTTVS
jgi:alpha-glucosidase